MLFPRLQALAQAARDQEYRLAEAMAETALGKKEVLAALRNMSPADRWAVCQSLHKMVQADEAGQV